jgi:hypothetical protein
MASTSTLLKAVCAHCDADVERKVGRRWFCAMHYRFQQMRSTAKRHGKTVPTTVELKALLTTGNRCLDCGCDMVWLAVQDQVRVATLQHYRDGSYGLVCRSCNTRHASMPGDSFRDLPADHKRCPQCEQVLPILMFSKDSGRTGPRKVKSWCKPCSTASLLRWQRENRDRYNELQRDGRAARRARDTAASVKARAQ